MKSLNQPDKKTLVYRPFSGNFSNVTAEKNERLMSAGKGRKEGDHHIDILELQPPSHLEVTPLHPKPGPEPSQPQKVGWDIKRELERENETYSFSAWQKVRYRYIEIYRREVLREKDRVRDTESRDKVRDQIMAFSLVRYQHRQCQNKYMC